ncbi:MAG: hypothetical protein HQ594_07290 [Candidatus Omnitrophica bacterium]|nr:hypothetical protein [Candidatus Omnitrophota bacterium]
MKRKKNSINIFTIGDKGDYDSHNKLNREANFTRKQGFNYETRQYKEFLKGRLPELESNKIIIFPFFPFKYWNKFIENREYRGLYGNLTFYHKFNRFCKEMALSVKKHYPGKKVLYINDPVLSSEYRDKKTVLDVLKRSGIKVPSTIKTRSVKEIKEMLEKGKKLFIKPRCGSMGKGITYLELGNWQTNFGLKKEKIISRRSDHGWRFRDETGNNVFLRKLLSYKDLLIEEAIDPLHIRGDKVDFRVYVFFDKVLYVYPRRNNAESVTTNISQGGRGAPGLLKVIPKDMLTRIEKTAKKALKALDLKLAGIDVIVSGDLKDVYVIDVNMFPGFPKVRTCNIAQRMIRELKRLDRAGKLRYSSL